MKKEYPKLPPSFKKKWVAALRSGKYKQGTGQLKTVKVKSTKWCCLGVACDISGLKVEQQSYIKGIKGSSIIPRAIRGSEGLPVYLSWLNDGYIQKDVKKKTFRSIATWIEKNL